MIWNQYTGQANLTRDSPCEFTLQRGEVVQIPVVTLCPEMAVLGRPMRFAPTPKHRRYTFLAALLIGAIVGGAPRWIVLGDPDERAAGGG